MTVNVYMNKIGLWTASLFDEAGREVEVMNGGYPKSGATLIDAQKMWGKEAEVVVSYAKITPSRQVELPFID
jgi:hypothetical protein